jgi:hypothetical protein
MPYPDRVEILYAEPINGEEKRLKRIAGIATKNKKMKVFVIGIGLIGGSMVLDIKKCIRKRQFMESIQMRFIHYRSHCIRCY